MKKIYTVILAALIMALSVLPALAVADNSKLTYLYLDKGSIVIGDGVVSGYGYFGEPVTTYDPDGYLITQTTTKNVVNSITVNGGENYIVLKSLNVNVSSLSKFNCAFCVTGGAEVVVKLEEVNIFISGDSRAGVEVETDSKITFMGDGTIMAGSNVEAGIGGGNGKSSGTVVINSGTIVGKSYGNSAGIGGGSTGDNGKVIINGGNVSGTGGPAGAGIGGGCTGNGGEVIINGGTVTAVGGTNGAGIGGGWYGDMGSVVINGGSVKATGGSKTVIGAGVGGTNGVLLNSEGEKLFLAKINVSSVSPINEVFTDGYDNNINSLHSGDAYLYFYLPSGTHIIAADSDSVSTSFWKLTYSFAFTSTRVTPFECLNSAYVNPDEFIRGLTCGLTSLNDFISLNDGFSFTYSDPVIGTGTDVVLVYNGTPVFNYKAMIYGDVNRDGFYDGEDSIIVSLMLNGFITNENVTEYLLEAADVNRNSEIDSGDVAVLQQAGLLLSSVPQAENGMVDTASAEWAEYTLLVDQAVNESDDRGSFILEIIDFIKYIAEYIKNFILSLFNI